MFTYLIYLLAAITAVVSTYLTTTLTYEIGKGSNLAMVFIAIGILFESSKYVLSIVAAKAHMIGDTGKAIVYGSATVLLMALSLVASIVSVESGSNSMVQGTEQYQDITYRIDTLRNQAIQSRELSEELPSNYITRKRELVQEAIQYDEQASALLAQRGELQPTTLLASAYKELAYVVAVAIGLIGLLLMPLVFVGYPPALSQKMNLKPVLVKDESIEDTQSRLVSDIKEAVRNKEVTPSCGGVRKKFSGIGNNNISDVLKELSQEGVLKPKPTGVGWDYA
ncbi:hypothetical protein [Vibrio crassostreae]|uniref:hypothetical protein n=1 Tax=Vibrio crassostreae TaxID=246167 RepID=UPI001B30B25A|nr:hypothetical protein [Vibrio crassostreae]